MNEKAILSIMRETKNELEQRKIEHEEFMKESEQFLSECCNTRNDLEELMQESKIITVEDVQKELKQYETELMLLDVENDKLKLEIKKYEEQDSLNKMHTIFYERSKIHEPVIHVYLDGRCDASELDAFYSLPKNQNIHLELIYVSNCSSHQINLKNIEKCKTGNMKILPFSYHTAVDSSQEVSGTITGLFVRDLASGIIKKEDTVVFVSTHVSLENVAKYYKLVHDDVYKFNTINKLINCMI